MKSIRLPRLPNPRRWLRLSPSSDSCRRQLPSSPGVYLFQDDRNKILYVGKSKSLKHRVSSYFQSGAGQIPKIKIFVPQIRQIQIAETDTEFAALLFEAECIKQLDPKYNSRLTDDRSPLYIVITDENFPRVLTARKTDLEGIQARKVYGPFFSGETVRRILKIARKLFPYCNQKRTVFGRSQGQSLKCLYRHLDLCPGVCTGEISGRQYLSIIKKLELFLTGDFVDLKVKLEREMKAASKRKNYEQAAKARDAIAALSSLTLAREHEEEISVKPEERVEAVIKLLNGLKSNLPLLNPISHFKFHTSVSPFRIEGFDVSHLCGRLATAAMVVFIGGIKETGEYRHFRIKASERNSGDPRMIAEAVQRRIGHPEWGKPDLIVIDGGEPQLSWMKRTVLSVRKGQSLKYLGLAKNPDRLVIPAENGFITVRVSPRDLGFQLLQQVRDEAHRFSRRLYLKLRAKALIG